MDTQDSIIIMAFDVKLLKEQDHCVWTPQGNGKYKCNGKPFRVVIQPDSDEAFYIGCYCKTHYSDKFPELAMKEDIYI